MMILYRSVGSWLYSDPTLICLGARARVLYDDGLAFQTADGWATRTNIDILPSLATGALFDGATLFLVPEIIVGAGGLVPPAVKVRL